MPKLKKRFMDLSPETGVTGADLNMSSNSKSRLHEIGHMVFLDAYKITEVDNKKGYIDLKKLGLEWVPISAKDVNLHISNRPKQVNYARVTSLDLPYDFCIGNLNLTYLYFRDVAGVEGDFDQAKTGCSDHDYTGDIFLVDVQVYKP